MSSTTRIRRLKNEYEKLSKEVGDLFESFEMKDEDLGKWKVGANQQIKQPIKYSRLS